MYVLVGRIEGSSGLVMEIKGDRLLLLCLEYI